MKCSKSDMKNWMYNEMGKNLVSVAGPLDTHLQNDECWGVNAAMVYLGLVPALWDLQLRPCSSPYHLKPEHRDNGEGWAESNMSVRELQQQPRDWNRTISNLERLVPYMCAELVPSNIVEWHHSPAASLRSHMAYSNNYKWKILGKWFQKIPKSITWTCHHGGTICIVFTFYNYLHSIYII